MVHLRFPSSPPPSPIVAPIMDGTETNYKVKYISFQNNKVPVFAQSFNGPCGLLAICNFLSLNNRLELDSEVDSISETKLMGILTEIFLRKRKNHDFTKAWGLIPKLSTGIDLDFGFTGIRDFSLDPVEHHFIFDFLDIPLVHGWIVDPEDFHTVKAVGSTYNHLTEYVSHAETKLDTITSRDQDVSGSQRRSKLAKKVSLVTKTLYGLQDLRKMHDYTLSILLMSSRFLTVYKFNGQLFSLVTDEAMLESHPGLIWERIDDKKGKTAFFNANFKELMGDIAKVNDVADDMHDMPNFETLEDGRAVNLGPYEMSADLSFVCEGPEPLEAMPTPVILKKKMPKRKRGHEDANNNHVKASNDVPQPKKLRKKLAEKKSSDRQQQQLKEKKEEPLDQAIIIKCQKRFVSATKRTVNLTDLTYDLVIEIAKRLKRLEDFTCFRSVSKSLCAVVKVESFEGLRLLQGTPYLMLPLLTRDDTTTCSTIGGVGELYSLVVGESIVTSFEVPVLTHDTLLFESLGWLLVIQNDGSMCLVDPFTRDDTGTGVIPVPHRNTYPEDEVYETHMFIRKMVLSSRPNEASDFILMVICGKGSRLAFWRLGDKAWNRIEDGDGFFLDVLYDCGSQFYASSSMGTIWVINLTVGGVVCRTLDCGSTHLVCMDLHENQYIVKPIDGSGSLLCIIRNKENDGDCLTEDFEVYELDMETVKIRRPDSLGNMAVFIGRNSSIAVDPSTIEGGGAVIKANHIYFTDDCWELQNIYFTDEWRQLRSNPRVNDNGVCNYKTSAIEWIYPGKPMLSLVSPSMWITPKLSYPCNNSKRLSLET